MPRHRRGRHRMPCGRAPSAAPPSGTMTPLGLLQAVARGPMRTHRSRWSARRRPPRRPQWRSRPTRRRPAPATTGRFAVHDAPPGRAPIETTGHKETPDDISWAEQPGLTIGPRTMFPRDGVFGWGVPGELGRGGRPESKRPAARMHRLRKSTENRFGISWLGLLAADDPAVDLLLHLLQVLQEA